MTFAGLNYLAVLAAAVAAWLVGAVWYMGLGRVWTAAHGWTQEEVHARQKQPGAYLPFIYTFMGELIMAWVLAGVLGHLGPGQVTFMNGVISGAFLWLGFVITTLATNNVFAGRKPELILIDGGHWLLVLVVMGAIIGAMGV